jgi:hypothetical protein
MKIFTQLQRFTMLTESQCSHTVTKRDQSQLLIPLTAALSLFLSHTHTHTHTHTHAHAHTHTRARARAPDGGSSSGIG